MDTTVKITEMQIDVLIIDKFTAAAKYSKSILSGKLIANAMKVSVKDSFHALMFL